MCSCTFSSAAFTLGRRRQRQSTVLWPERTGFSGSTECTHVEPERDEVRAREIQICPTGLSTTAYENVYVLALLSVTFGCYRFSRHTYAHDYDQSAGRAG